MQQRYRLTETENTIVDGLIELFNARYGIEIGDVDITFEKHPPQDHLKACSGMVCKEEWGIRVLFFTQTLGSFLMVACHELIHVKQVILEGLENIEDGSYFYKGERIDPDQMDYDARPWEQEAWNMQDCFAEEYLLHFAPNSVIHAMEREFLVQ